VSSGGGTDSWRGEEGGSSSRGWGNRQYTRERESEIKLFSSEADKDNKKLNVGFWYYFIF
jgi:hypothetical protein